MQKLLSWPQKNNSKSIIMLLKRCKRKSKKVLYSLTKTVISIFIDSCWLKGNYQSELDFLRMLFDTSDVALEMHDYVYSLQLLLADGFYENVSYKLWFAIKRTRQVIAKDRQNVIIKDLNALIRDILVIAFLPISDHPGSLLFWNRVFRHILTIPFFISSLDQESFKIIREHEIYFHLSHQLMDYRAIMYTQSGEESLFFLSNLGVYTVRQIQSKNDDMAHQEYMERVFLPIALLLIQHCSGFLRSQKTNPRCIFHHFFKWYEGFSLQLEDIEVSELYTDVSSLWSEKIIKPIFALIESVGRLTTIDRSKKSKYSLRRKSIGNVKARSPDSPKRFSFSSLRRSSLPSLNNHDKLTSNHQLHDYDQCSFFPNLLLVLRNQAPSITSTIAHSQQSLNIIWKILRQSFELCHEDINFLVSATARESKDFPLNIFSLFCDCGTILFSTLDDHEIYDNQHPFKLNELDEIRTFLNIYCLLLCQKPARIKSEFAKSLFQTAKKFLMVLEEMNANRKFISAASKSKLSISWDDLTKKIAKGHLESLCILHDMPHCIPFENRVEIFRMYVQNDKANVYARRLKKPLKVRRDYILEDGFKQISKLTDAQVKIAVKIEFINTFGLKEAGIDQSGVFKEFLGEICKQAFNPDLNLFQSAANGTFCISPNSSYHGNHLQIFFFIGRILGKALYDGVVLDIPLARFIFAKFLGRYNYFEDLPFLDSDLYKNLIFLKHYTGIYFDSYFRRYKRFESFF
jgi:ubiquitin-protein ligase E3 B